MQDDRLHFGGETRKRTSLVKAMNMDQVYSHLVTFSDIARPRSRSRSVLNGFNASATYIYKTLKSQTNYDVEYQAFEVDLFSDAKPPTLNINGKEYVASKDFGTVQKSGSGSIRNGTVVFLKNGCTRSDFKSVSKNDILLLSREGPCDYKTMLEVAAQSGPAAILLYTTLPVTGPVHAACKEPIDTPIIGLSHYAALDLLEMIASGHSKTVIRASLSTHTQLIKTTTVNVIATTPEGDDASVILAGSHLDSVPEGPGINDDASGAAATLEVALEFYRSGLSKKTIQKVRFGFWSGEELGLLGSEHYVEHLYARNQTDLKKIKLNLNNDMIASPNFIRYASFQKA